MPIDKSKSRIVFSINSPFINKTAVETFQITESISKLEIAKNKNYQNSLRPVVALTSNIISTYKYCNHDFLPVSKLPRRILTQPSEGVLNHGLDNGDSNLVCRVHDILESAHGKYTVLDLLGTGTFGQVFRCQKDDTKEVVAVKVIKNKPAYHNQGQLEAKIAKLLNQKYDVRDEKHIVRLLHQFECKGHICLVFELLSMSLLDVLTQNQFRGLPLNVVQRFTKQILSALVAFQEAAVIHCDLKPENILLSVPKTTPPSTDNNPGVKRELTEDQNKSSESSFNGDTSGNNASSSSSSQGGNKKHSGALTSSRLSTALSLHNQNAATAFMSGNGEIVSGFTSPVTTNASTSPCTNMGISPKDQAADTNKTASAELPSSSNSRNAIWSELKVIDLGSACFEGQTMYSYIQSRFYRSPEVLLGVPYNGAIDMWSLGCVCAEMFLGLPLFPGVSQHNQLTRIVEMFGLPPDYLIDGKNGHKYFSYIGNNGAPVATGSRSADVDNDFELSRQQQPYRRGLSGNNEINSLNAVNALNDSSNESAMNMAKASKYRIKSAEEYARETKTDVPTLKKYLRYNRLEDVVLKYPLMNRSKMSPEHKREEVIRRHCFLNFLEGLFSIDPFLRWTPKQAANHPFITGAPYQGKFIPPVDPKINDRKLAYLLQMQRRHDSNRNSNAAAAMSASANSTAKGGLLYGNSSLFKNILQPGNTSQNNDQQNRPQQQHYSEPQQQAGHFPPLSRRQTEPVMGQETHTQDSDEQYLEFESRPVLQRGKPVTPETSSLVNMSVSWPDQSNLLSIPGINPQDPYNGTNNRLVQQHHNHHYDHHNHPAEKNVAYTPYHLNQNGGMPRYFSDDPNSSNNKQQQQQQQQQQDSKQRTAHTYTVSGASHQLSHYVPFQSNSSLPSSHKQQSELGPTERLSQSYSSQDYSQLQKQQQQLQQQQLLPPVATQLHTSSLNTGFNAKVSASAGSSYSSSSDAHSLFSVGNNPVQMSDFAQALIRPEMDEQRYFHSTQQLQQQQQQQRQHHENQMNLIQQQQQQKYSWFNAPRNRLSSAGVTWMSSSPNQQQQQQQQQYQQQQQQQQQQHHHSQQPSKQIPRSYDLKSKFSAFMGSFRSNDSASNNSSSGRMKYSTGPLEDELSTTYHGNNDRVNNDTASFDPSHAQRMRTSLSHHQLDTGSPVEELYTTRFGNVSSNSMQHEKWMSQSSRGSSDRWLGSHGVNDVHGQSIPHGHSESWLPVSGHGLISLPSNNSLRSMTSQSSDFLAVNRMDTVAELGRTRLDAENDHMDHKMSMIGSNGEKGNEPQSQQPSRSLKMSVSFSDLNSRNNENMVTTSSLLPSPYASSQQSSSNSGMSYGNNNSSVNEFRSQPQTPSSHAAGVSRDLLVYSNSPTRLGSAGNISTSPHMMDTDMSLKAQSPLVSDPDSDPFFTSDDLDEASHSHVNSSNNHRSRRK